MARPPRSRQDLYRAAGVIQPAETQLLRLCARPYLDDGADRRLRELVQQPLDWRRIFRLAEAHRTTPLLAQHLRRHTGELLAPEIRAELQRHHLASTRHNLVLAAEVLRVVDLFSTAGIAVVPFKGVLSAMRIYADMAMRACGDIDLLVRPQDHGRAERLLEEHGYRVTQRYEGAMQSGLHHEQRQISLDLHWGLPPQMPRMDSDRLWDALAPVTLLERQVLTFSPLDTLLVTANNAVKEYWKPSLHQLSDIAALTHGYTTGDWLAAFHRARELGCRRMLVAALLFTRRVLDTPLPSVGPARLFRHPGLGRVVDELEDHLFLQTDVRDSDEALKPLHHRAMQAYYLSLIDPPWQRTREWLKWAGTPSSADREFFKLPRMLSFLYFVLRPLRVLIKRL